MEEAPNLTSGLDVECVEVSTTTEAWRGRALAEKNQRCKDEDYVKLKVPETGISIPKLTKREIFRGGGGGKEAHSIPTSEK